MVDREPNQQSRKPAESREGWPAVGGVEKILNELNAPERAEARESFQADLQNVRRTALFGRQLVIPELSAQILDTLATRAVSDPLRVFTWMVSGAFTEQYFRSGAAILLALPPQWLQSPDLSKSHFGALAMTLGRGLGNLGADSLYTAVRTNLRQINPALVETLEIGYVMADPPSAELRQAARCVNALRDAGSCPTREEARSILNREEITRDSAVSAIAFLLKQRILPWALDAVEGSLNTDLLRRTDQSLVINVVQKAAEREGSAFTLLNIKHVSNLISTHSRTGRA